MIGIDRFYTALAELFRHDPGNRGLAARAPVPDLAALTASLKSATHALVLTGFPVLLPQGAPGETDGPPGAANIAAALLALGVPVTLVTDPWSQALVAAARDARAPKAGLAVIPFEGAAAHCAALIDKARPSHIIAIERPGQCGGAYHNMRGADISHVVSDTDSLFDSKSAVKIAIGDGGNELGMGALRQQVLESVPGGEHIVADRGCDFALVAGISNWWGWGLGALLSVACGRDLLPSDAQEAALLDAVVAAGGVDGVSGQRVATVDGLPLSASLAVLGRIRTLTHAQLK